MNTENIPFKLKAILGHATLSKEDFIEMAPGDIVVLDQPFTEPFEITVEGTPFFLGFPGLDERKRVVQIGGPV